MARWSFETGPITLNRAFQVRTRTDLKICKTEGDFLIFSVYLSAENDCSNVACVGKKCTENEEISIEILKQEESLLLINAVVLKDIAKHLDNEMNQ